MGVGVRGLGSRLQGLGVACTPWFRSTMGVWVWVCGCVGAWVCGCVGVGVCGGYLHPLVAQHQVHHL